MNDIRLPWKDWRIVKKLGGGSYGTVFEIERKSPWGDVEKGAVKIIRVPHFQDEYNTLVQSGYDEKSISTKFFDDLGKYVQEYKMMNQLKGNPNVIICDDVQYTDNPDGIGYLLFIRMELLHSLHQVIPRQPDDALVIRVGTDICNALTACRKHNIIHRDIKPDNILADDDGRFKLGDFGVSKIAERTEGGTRMGTETYMAPEVNSGREYNNKADIYSLGLVLYVLLNRRISPFLPLPPAPPPSADEVQNAKDRRFRGEALPPPTDGSEALKAVVLKACAFDPADRYQSPEEFAAALRSCANAAAPVKQPEPAVGSASFRDEAAATQRTLGNSWDSTAAGTVGAAPGMAVGATVGASPKPQPSAPAPAPAPQPVSAPPVRQPEPPQSFSEATMGNSWGCDLEETVGTVGAAYAEKTVGASPNPQEIDWTAGERTALNAANPPKSTGIWDTQSGDGAESEQSPAVTRRALENHIWEQKNIIRSGCNSIVLLVLAAVFVISAVFGMITDIIKQFQKENTDFTTLLACVVPLFFVFLGFKAIKSIVKTIMKIRKAKREKAASEAKLALCRTQGSDAGEVAVVSRETAAKGCTVRTSHNRTIVIPPGKTDGQIYSGTFIRAWEHYQFNPQQIIPDDELALMPDEALSNLLNQEKPTAIILLKLAAGVAFPTLMSSISIIQIIIGKIEATTTELIYSWIWAVLVTAVVVTSLISVWNSIKTCSAISNRRIQLRAELAKRK